MEAAYKNRKQLVVFTATYPYGNGETFLEQEIEYLVKNFSKVIIVPWEYEGNARATPENVEILHVFKEYSYNRTLVLTSFLKQLCYIAWSEHKCGHIKKNNIRVFLSDLLRTISKAAFVENKIASINEDSILYTFWFDEWATVLSILKHRNVVDAYISRAHGFDLYEERQKSNFRFYRKFQLEQVEKVITISNDGYEYLVKKYPQYTNKYITHRLGTKDYGASNGADQIGIIHIVTCARVVPVKRMHLLVECLMLVKRKVNWIHFGDGPLLDNLKNQAKLLPKNISAEFKGNIANSEVLEYLKSEDVNLFVNVSESEGLPVSIMEAISFGIPVFATNVGGVKEIVSTEVGVLFSKDGFVKEMANTIERYEELGLNSKGSREKIREFWLNNYSSKQNYEKLGKFLLSYANSRVMN